MSDLKLFAKRLKKFIAPIAAVLSVAILLMSDTFFTTYKKPLTTYPDRIKKSPETLNI